MSKINQMKREIEKDINSIKEVLNKDYLDEMMKIHKYMDSKYQSKIDTWGLSQFGWSDNLGFDYDFIGKSGISENLENMIGKLEGYKQDLDLKVYEIFNGKNSSGVKIYNSNKNANANTNTNTNATVVNFSIVENNLKNNESLTEEQTIEALKKLEELRSIYQSKDNKKTKWSKVKPIMIWLADKSVDVGIAFLPLITSMFGG